MYDEDLSNRLRETLEGTASVSEKRMMGGLCFMMNGNMLCGAHLISGEASCCRDGEQPALRPGR